MRIVLLQIVASVAALLVLALWPRAGQPVLLGLPPGAAVGPAFEVEDWRILRVIEAGPVVLLLAAPQSDTARVAALRGAVGAVFAIAASAAGDCAPIPGRAA
jgi:hypothetical protein